LNEGCFDEQHQQGNKVVPSPPPETLWWQPKTFVYEKDWSGSAQNFALVKGGLRPLTSHQALQSTWSSGVGDFTVHVTVDKPGTLLFGLYPSNETFPATDPVKHFASMATESYWVGETSLVDPPEVDSSATTLTYMNGPSAWFKHIKVSSDPTVVPTPSIPSLPKIYRKNSPFNPPFSTVDSYEEWAASNAASNADGTIDHIVPIASSLGTPFGDISGGDGLTGLFDGVWSNSYGTGDASNGVHYGLDWGEGIAKTIHQVHVLASSALGGIHSGNPSDSGSSPSTDLTWTVYGSMFAPLGATNGVVLGTYRTTDMAVIQPTGAAAKFITVGPLTSRTAYRYHWVHAVDNSGSTGNSHTVGECEFYQHTKDSLFQISEGDVVTFNRVKGQTSLWVNGALALTYPFVSTADMRFAVSSHGWGYVVVVVVHAVFVMYL